MITKSVAELNIKIDEFLEVLIKTIPTLIEGQEKINKKLDKLIKEKEVK